jgi:hypothetical protein
MKRLCIILGVAGVTAILTYLAVTRQMAQERASRLDRALADAEARVIALEQEIELANSRLSEVQRLRESPRKTAASVPDGKAAPTATATQAVSVTGTSLTLATQSARGAATPDPVAVAVVPGPAFVQAGPLERYAAAAGATDTNVVRIEGTSTVHPWQVEGHLIGGTAEFAHGFPPQAVGQVSTGDINARVSVFLPVRSLKSVEADGRPYSDVMDEIMYVKLRAEAHKRITFVLTSLKRLDQPEEKGPPFRYEATGELCVAGVTNTVAMPVYVTPGADGKVLFAGTVKVKMTDFKITPPAPTFAGGAIKTGDDVTLSFSWWAKRLGPMAAK